MEDSPTSRDSRINFFLGYPFPTSAPLIVDDNERPSLAIEDGTGNRVKACCIGRPSAMNGL